MTVRSRLGSLRRTLLSSVYTRPLPLEGRGPVVSFCFDDFPRSAYSTGGVILKSFGARGTYYAAPGLLDSSNALGDQLTRVDMEDLLRDGHELGCHTFHHSSCRSLSLSAFEHDVSRGREVLRELTGCDPANFAYPYGHVSLSAKRNIGFQMDSARGIYGGINTPVADLNLLRANSLYGDLDQSSQVEALLAETCRCSGWLIFYTHDVRQRPSPFGCTPALFERAVTLAAESGCAIVPIRSALAGFRTAAEVGSSKAESPATPA